MSATNLATPAFHSLEATLRHWIHELCDTPPTFDAQLSLMELGMDSVRLLSLLDKVRRFGPVLSFTEVLEGPTFTELVALIEVRLAHAAPDLINDRGFLAT